MGRAKRAEQHGSAAAALTAPPSPLPPPPAPVVEATVSAALLARRPPGRAGAPVPQPPPPPPHSPPLPATPRSLLCRSPPPPGFGPLPGLPRLPSRLRPSRFLFCLPALPPVALSRLKPGALHCCFSSGCSPLLCVTQGSASCRTHRPPSPSPQQKIVGIWAALKASPPRFSLVAPARQCGGGGGTMNGVERWAPPLMSSASFSLTGAVLAC